MYAVSMSSVFFSLSLISTARTSIGGDSPSASARFQRFVLLMPTEGCNSESATTRITRNLKW